MDWSSIFSLVKKLDDLVTGPFSSPIVNEYSVNGLSPKRVALNAYTRGDSSHPISRTEACTDTSVPSPGLWKRSTL